MAALWGMSILVALSLSLVLTMLQGCSREMLWKHVEPLGVYNIQKPDASVVVDLVGRTNRFLERVGETDVVGGIVYTLPKSVSAVAGDSLVSKAGFYIWLYGAMPEKIYLFEDRLLVTDIKPTVGLVLLHVDWEEDSYIKTAEAFRHGIGVYGKKYLWFGQ